MVPSTAGRAATDTQAPVHLEATSTVFDLGTLARRVEEVLPGPVIRAAQLAALAGTSGLRIRRYGW